MNIEQFYEKIYTDKSYRKADNFIEFIESNIDLINNIEIGEDKELHDKILRLIIDYAHSLTLCESFRKALPQINKAIDLFESHPDHKNTDLIRLPNYEYLIFDRAEANYYLKNIKSAIKDLEILNTEFPDNDKYDNWLSNSLKYQTRQILRIVWYIIGGAVLLTTFIEKETIGFWYNILLGIIAIGLLVIIPTEFVIREKKKTIKNGG